MVIASVAVLLSDWRAWYCSVSLSGFCVFWLFYTYLSTFSTIIPSQEKVKIAEQAYEELRKVHVSANEDESTVELLDPGKTIRNQIDGK